MNAHEVHKQVRDLEQALRRNTAALAKQSSGYRPEIGAEAHRIVRESADLRWENPAKSEAWQLWYRANDHLRAVMPHLYPPGFETALTALRAGDLSGVEPAVRYLELDPWFPGSGYAKEDAIRFLKRVRVSDEQAERLRAVVLQVIRDAGCRREFPKYAVLAKSVESPELRKSLIAMEDSPDDSVRRRAQWVLDVLDGIDPRRRHRTWYDSQLEKYRSDARTILEERQATHS